MIMVLIVIGEVDGEKGKVFLEVRDNSSCTEARSSSWETSSVISGGSQKACFIFTVVFLFYFALGNNRKPLISPIILIRQV